MLSYTKAILDYKLATQYEEKILGNEAKLVKIKVYFPSESLLSWRESIAETPGEPTNSVNSLKSFVKALEKELKVKAVATGWNEVPQDIPSTKVSLVTKTMNNRYKLAGDFCVRLYYAVPEGTVGDPVHFPADPGIVSQWNAKEFVSTYTKILDAYSVSKDYVKRLRERTTVLRDEF